MRLTLKDHRDAMVAMLANGNCPTSAARLAHAMHDVLSYLQSEPEAPVSHSERRDEATTPGLNDKLLALDVGALAKPQTVNKRVRKLEATVKARDNTVNQLKENIRLLRDERAELTRQLQEALDREQCLQEWLKHIDAGEQSGVRKEDTQLPDDGWIEWSGKNSDRWPTESGETIVDVKYACGFVSSGFKAKTFNWGAPGRDYSIVAYRVVKPLHAGVRKEDTQLPMTDWSVCQHDYIYHDTISARRCLHCGDVQP